MERHVDRFGLALLAAWLVSLVELWAVYLIPDPTGLFYRDDQTRSAVLHFNPFTMGALLLIASTFTALVPWASILLADCFVKGDRFVLRRYVPLVGLGLIAMCATWSAVLEGGVRGRAGLIPVAFAVLVALSLIPTCGHLVVRSTWR